MNVVENLYEYLRHNTNAEIPGLGTFSVKTSSAQINESAGTIIPPSRKVVFDKKQDGNKDFIAFMAKREFISLETAETWIKQYSDSLVSKLEKEEVKLDRLGTLKQGYVGEYSFTPEENLNLMDDVFALGELKNIKTYKAESNIDLIHTKTAPVSQQHIEESHTQQEDIAPKVEDLETIKESNRIQETQQETEERISQHEEIEVEVPTPINTGEKVDALNMDIALDNQDKTLEPIKEESEAEKQETSQENNASVQQEESIDELHQQAMNILSKYDHQNQDSKKSKRKKHKDGKKKKKLWFIIFWIVLALLLLCAGFVGAHYMGWLKNIDFLKPVTEKLAYYVPIRQVSQAKPAATPVVTPTQEENNAPIEVSPTEVLEEEVLNHDGLNANPANRNQTTKTPKPTPKQTTTETKKTEPETPVVVDNSPVLTQGHSKLGFDVVGATFDSKQKAEAGARKARSLGYDGYVISKIKNGNPIYYVSYGSRRTFKEATDLMQSMVNKMGGSYYVMSR